jgi:predicted ester cyclase
MNRTHELVQAFYDRIWNAGEIPAVDELLAADFAFRGSLGPEMRGPRAFSDYVRMVRSALNNYRCEILDLVIEDNRAFAKMRFSGIHASEFRGYAPTGKAVQWLAAALFYTDGTRIKSLWVLGDLSSLDTLLKENAAKM